MEITNIETRILVEMMRRFESLANKIETVYHASEDKSLQKWLDNEDVCEILNVSKRTLQYYRDSGMIAFTQINYKVFCQPQDVQALIDKLKRKQQ